jgi:hypothetical protein
MTYNGPFTVKYLDGREEQIDAAVVFEDDLADLWREHRHRGAVLLRDADNVCRDHNYTEANLARAGLAPGASVRHKRHPELTGRVDHFEYHSPGRLSMMPLTVYWDQASASELLGWFSIYPSPESLELVEEQVPA